MGDLHKTKWKFIELRLKRPSHTKLSFMAVPLIIASLVGCSPTEQSLDSAAIKGNAPSEPEIEFQPTSGTFADMFNIEISWESVPDATGYQLQEESEWAQSGWYTLRPNKDKQNDLLMKRTSLSTYLTGFEQSRTYRVRGVLDNGDSVTPWSQTATVTTPKGNVLYEVEGTAGSASITMRTNSGSEQATVSLPLKSKSGETGLWLQATNMNPYISAQAKSAGTVTCRITAKGVVVSENTSSGHGSIATCSM